MPADTCRKPPHLDAVVFDLGGVLIDWNPRYLYRTLFGGDRPAVPRPGDLRADLLALGLLPRAAERRRASSRPRSGR